MRRLTLLAPLLLLACDDGEGAAPLQDAAIVRVDGGPRLDLGAAPPFDQGFTLDASPPRDAGPLEDAREADLAHDAGEIEHDAGEIVADMAVAEDLGPVIDAAPADPWPRRRCEIEIAYTDPGAAAVSVAGAFSDWTPRPMIREGDRFSVTLDARDGLSPGQLYAYKLVVDGRWILDPEGTHRKYDGDCVNSAFLFPDCEAPAVTLAPIRPQLSENRGAVTVQGRAFKAASGAEIVDLSARLDGEAVALAVDESGAFSVALTALEIGRHTLSVRAIDAAGEAAAPIDAVFWVEASPFEWRSGPLYLLFIDRFANGARDTDDPVGAPVPYGADWHGGDLWGALAALEDGYFDRLGVKSIWLSPVNRQVEGHFGERDPNADPNHQITAYHGYWPIRAREVDPRYGGDEALRAFIEAAHRRGIRVLLDLINNQIHAQHEYMAAHPDWFRSDCLCGIDPGCGWSERPLDCLFAAYLPDINWRQPEAQAQFISDALYWIEAFGVDGFRVDAVKHVETTSIYNLRAAISERFEAGGARIVMLGETAVSASDRFDDQCGEVYASGYEWIAAYTGPAALDGQFDFPTHHRMQAGLLDGTLPFDALEGILADMEAAYPPESLHVQFLGSHDASRMASRAAGDPAAGCRFDDQPGCAQLATTPEDPAVFARLRRAQALLMTMPGLPLLYYGDEIALPGGNDPDSRRDMIWGDGLAALDMSGGALSAQQQALRGWMEALGALRGAHPALAVGARRELYIEPDFYAFARWTAEDVVVAAFSRSEAWIEREVSLAPIGRAVPSLRVALGEGEVTVEGAVMRLRIAPQAAVILTP
ncbi:hypothetical protein KKF91_05735 [Myxococcota bacterium]|nr:hypothetical protein [Myxococcota bacterium]